MAALRKKDLVIGNKYNRAEIMRRAWAYYRNPFNTVYRGNFKRALQDAWLDARIEMKERNEPEQELKFNPNIRPSDLRPHGRANNFMYGY